MARYPAGSTALSALLPAWVHAGGRDALLARLADAADRARIRVVLDGPGMARDAGWDGIVIAGCPARPEYEGQTLARIAAGLGMSPDEAVIEGLRQAKGDADMILFMMSEDNVALGLGRPWVMIGSDGEGRAARGQLGIESLDDGELAVDDDDIGECQRPESRLNDVEAIAPVLEKSGRRRQPPERGARAAPPGRAPCSPR